MPDYAFKEVAEAEFRKDLKEPGWLLVDLFGRGCPPCTSGDAEKNVVQKSQPPIEIFLRMDVEKAKGVLEEFQINGIPTLILFKDGRRRSQFVDIPDRDGKNVLAWLKAELT